MPPTTDYYEKTNVLPTVASPPSAAPVPKASSPPVTLKPIIPSTVGTTRQAGESFLSEVTSDHLEDDDLLEYNPHEDEYYQPNNGRMETAMMTHTGRGQSGITLAMLEKQEVFEEEENVDVKESSSPDVVAPIPRNQRGRDPPARDSTSQRFLAVENPKPFSRGNVENGPPKSTNRNHVPPNPTGLTGPREKKPPSRSRAEAPPLVPTAPASKPSSPSASSSRKKHANIRYVPRYTEMNEISVLSV